MRAKHVYVVIGTSPCPWLHAGVTEIQDGLPVGAGGPFACADEATAVLDRLLVSATFVVPTHPSLGDDRDAEEGLCVVPSAQLVDNSVHTDVVACGELRDRA